MFSPSSFYAHQLIRNRPDLVPPLLTHKARSLQGRYAEPNHPDGAVIRRVVDWSRAAVAVSRAMVVWATGRSQNVRLGTLHCHHWQVSHDNLVHESENRGVGADTQSQRENCNASKARILPQDVRAVSDILPKRCAPSALPNEPNPYFKRMRSKLSHADMSERITLSPTFNPETISMVFTELRPNFTLTRVASVPSSSSLKIPTVLSDCP
jgi:hypothetical protein